MKEEEAAKTAWRKKGQDRPIGAGGTNKGARKETSSYILRWRQAKQEKSGMPTVGWKQGERADCGKDGTETDGLTDMPKRKLAPTGRKAINPGGNANSTFISRIPRSPSQPNRKAHPAESGFTTGAQNGDRRKRQKTSTQGKGQHTRNRSQELSGRKTGHIPKGNKYAENNV